jgi:hypothetical protein
MVNATGMHKLIWLSACALGGLTLSCSASEEPDKKKPVTDVTLPDPGPLGFQLDTGEFEVAPGEEVQDCYFFEVPFDEEVWVNRITLGQNSGSHHMNVFRVRTVQNLDAAPGEVVKGGECWKSPNWADWPLVTNSQTSGIEDWKMPQGVALKLQPREKIMLQSHYVNASTQKTPGDARVIVNFYGVEKANVTDELGTLFATNQEISICPGDVHRTFEASCKGLAKDKPVTLVAANGHFHSRGQRFTMNEWDPVNGKGAQFYESTRWDEPPFDKNLNVVVPPGGGISWTCDFSVKPDDCGDPNNDCCFTFGGYVEYQEHCNAFVYYYPRGATDVNCF